MSDDEKPLDLRDKIAIEILGGMLANEKTSSMISEICSYHSSKNLDDRNHAHKRAENVVRAAYVMADIVRKVRLTAFE